MLESRSTSGFKCCEDVLPEVQNSLFQLDPVFICCGHTIFAREIRVCHDNHKWFSDEIMLCAAEKLLEMCTTEQRLDDQDNDQSRIVFIKSTHAFTHALLQHLVIVESAQKRGGRKINTTHKMNEGL